MELQGRSKSIESINSGMSALSFAGRKVKLPKLEMRKFSGKITEWQEFWDGFKSAIHDDAQLANVDKFKYLKSYLEESARSVVTGFPLTEKNYVTAIELLKKRYAKPGVIKKAHINELINLSPVFSEKSVNRIRNLHDQIETRFRAMEAQDINKESYSSVVVPILLSKIPETLRNNMIRFGGNHLDWNLDDMLVALEKELDVLEGHFPIMQSQQLPQHGRAASENRRPKSGNQQPGTASALFTGKRCRGTVHFAMKNTCPRTVVLSRE